MNIIVVGIGGNGQTYFMQYLHEKSFRLNHLHDADKLKHNSCPTNLNEHQKNSKIIYVYNKNNLQSNIGTHKKFKIKTKNMKRVKFIICDL